MDYAAARYRMVENQVRANRVIDERVISVVSELPREEFVPESKADIAYIDEALEVDEGRYLMEPMVMARLLQSAQPKMSDVALVIGSADGYSSAVLAKIVSTVVAVESNSKLIDKANSVLSKLEIDNVAVMEGSLTGGYPKQAPYDVIVFNGAVNEIPEGITDQLAEGGRLVAVVDKGVGMGTIVIQTRVNGLTAEHDVFDAGTPFLPGYKSDPEFIF